MSQLSSAASAAAPPTLLEAFATSAAQLRHFGIPRVRVVGLSEGCTQADYDRQRSRPDGKDMETLLQESTLQGPHGALGAASRRVQTLEDARELAKLKESVPIVTEQEFMHKFVFHSRPCVIIDAIDAWPAMQRWRDDRYVFDLDHQLPLEPERPTESDDDDDEEEEVEDDEEEAECACAETASDTQSSSTPTPAGEKTKEKSAGSAAAAAAESNAPAPVLGPKKVTVALTPNGRADAVTVVTYATSDVPEDEAASVYAGAAAKADAVQLPSPSASTDSTVRHEKIFMSAAELRMTLPQLYGLLQRSPTHPPPRPGVIDMRTYADASRTPVIAYAQLQNNCLNTEYSHLHVDLGTNVERFGCRVFDKAEVEAANVWFGVPASVSSLHQDWVENLYSVVRGVKEFVLIPPWEGPFIPKPEIPAAAFAIDESGGAVDMTDDTAQSWSVRFRRYPRKDGTMVPWMDFDLSGAEVEADAEGAATAELERRLFEKRRATAARWPTPLSESEARAAAAEEARRKPLHPLVAYVHPGETLYLPAMWLHRVAQHADTTDAHARATHRADSAAAAAEPPLPLIAAVNYWYDMSFSNPAVVLLREFGLLL